MQGAGPRAGSFASRSYSGNRHHPHFTDEGIKSAGLESCFPATAQASSVGGRGQGDAARPVGSGEDRGASKEAPFVTSGTEFGPCSSTRSGVRVARPWIEWAVWGLLGPGYPAGFLPLTPGPVLSPDRFCPLSSSSAVSCPCSTTWASCSG